MEQPYEVMWSQVDHTLTIRTSWGVKAARRFAEFEAEKDVHIRSIFPRADGATDYLFRYGEPILMPDVEKASRAGSTIPANHGPGCPHSKFGRPEMCSLCIDVAERAEIIRLIKEGKL